MKKNHYETLGINPDATEAEVKRAYRSKARATHPDKGGSADEFAPVAEAFEVLSDTGRRQLYDATGRDDRNTMEFTVQNELMKAFSAAISMPDEYKSIVETVRGAFTRAVENIDAEREKIENERPILLAKRERVKTSNEVNLVHMLIDEELKRIEHHVFTLDHQKEVMEACLKELESYSEKMKPKPVVADFQGFSFERVTLGDMMKINENPFG